MPGAVIGVEQSDTARLALNISRRFLVGEISQVSRVRRGVTRTNLGA